MFSITSTFCSLVNQCTDKIISLKNPIHQHFQVRLLIIIALDEYHPILSQELSRHFQPIFHKCQPHRVVEFVIVRKRIVPCVVRRVDVDELHFPREFLFEGVEGDEVVAFDDEIFGDRAVGTSLVIDRTIRMFIAKFTDRYLAITSMPTTVHEGFRLVEPIDLIPVDDLVVEPFATLCVVFCHARLEDTVFVLPCECDLSAVGEVPAVDRETDLVAVRRVAVLEIAVDHRREKRLESITLKDGNDIYLLTKPPPEYRITGDESDELGIATIGSVEDFAREELTVARSKFVMREKSFLEDSFDLLGGILRGWRGRRECARGKCFRWHICMGIMYRAVPLCHIPAPKAKICYLHFQ